MTTSTSSNFWSHIRTYGIHGKFTYHAEKLNFHQNWAPSVTQYLACDQQ